MAALKRKKMNETELDRLAGTRMQLEMQVNTLESANLNAETMAAMKKASDALKVIHGNTYVRCLFKLDCCAHWSPPAPPAHFGLHSFASTRTLDSPLFISSPAELLTRLTNKWPQCKNRGT